MIRLEQVVSKENQSNNANSKISHSSGRWTKEEHQKFIEGLKKFGKNWKQVEEYVGTRNGAQIRSHAQKFFNRLEREYNVKLEGSKKEGGKKNKKSSVRKASECSISTSCTNPGKITPNPFKLFVEAIKELAHESILDEEESSQHPHSEMASFPATSKLS